jgi:hypothetical protein
MLSNLVAIISYWHCNCYTCSFAICTLFFAITHSAVFLFFCNHSHRPIFTCCQTQLQCTGVAIIVNKLVFATIHCVFWKYHTEAFATTLISFLEFFGAGGLYWSLAFLLNLLDNNSLTVSQTTSWESVP